MPFKLTVNGNTSTVDSDADTPLLWILRDHLSGVIWAITQLMTEITLRNGRVEQSSYADYTVPRIADTPPIEIHILGSDNPQAFGMGEPPVPPFAPAVLNAIFNATGKRIRRLPLT